MREVPSLTSICVSSLINLNKNGEPTNPDFKTIFGKIYNGTAAQLIVFEYLKKRPAIELACLPFFEDACDDYINLIFGALEEVVIHGCAEEWEKALIALLQNCQSEKLPESIRAILKLFLFHFLEKMDLTDQTGLPCFARSIDPNQIMVHALRVFLRQNIIEIDAYNKGGLSNVSRDYEKEYQSSIQSIRECNKQIYGYLKKNDAHIDQRLLDDAVELFVKGWPELAEIICEILTDPNHVDANADVFNREVNDFQEILSNYKKKIPTPHLLTYLREAAERPGCPETAYQFAAYLEEKELDRVIFAWCDCTGEMTNEERVNYFSKAALQGHQLAIKELNKIAEHCKYERVEPLNDIYHPDAMIDRQEWTNQVKAITEKILRELDFYPKSMPIFDGQEKLGCRWDATVKERIELGSKFLKKESDEKRFKGAQILEGLSKLDHPLASEARQILDMWLGEGTNRIWFNEIKTQLIAV